MNTTPEAFALSLRNALKKKFGQRVTAAYLARELDIFSKGEVIVTAEGVCQCGGVQFCVQLVGHGVW